MGEAPANHLPDKNLGRNLVSGHGSYSKPKNSWAHNLQTTLINHLRQNCIAWEFLRISANC